MSDTLLGAIIGAVATIVTELIGFSVYKIIKINKKQKNKISQSYIGNGGVQIGVQNIDSSTQQIKEDSNGRNKG